MAAKLRGRHASSLYALAAAFAAAWGAVLLLRPNDGLIEPDPVDVQDYFSPDDIVRARRFGRPQLALQLAGSAIQAAAVIALTRRPPKIAVRGHVLVEAALSGAALSSAVGLAPLPVRASAHRRAVKFGLSRQPWRAWMLDLAKSSTIEAALSGGVSAAAVWLMRRKPRGWWLPAAGGSVVLAALTAFLAPVALDPLFNRFTVLPDGPLRDEILRLADQAGIRVGEVYSVDASKRTTAANAYVTGLGATKRIVLFDTLLDRFTAAETRLVVSHELAHVRHRDVARNIAHMALAAPAAMYASARLLSALGRDPERVPADAQTLPALTLALGISGVALASAASALSRRIEARADAFALTLTGEAEPFIAFEQRIVNQNLADPDPPRWLVRLLASHPPARERIGIARAYQRAAS